MNETEKQIVTCSECGGVGCEFCWGTGQRYEHRSKGDE